MIITYEDDLDRTDTFILSFEIFKISTISVKLYKDKLYMRIEMFTYLNK